MMGDILACEAVDGGGSIVWLDADGVLRDEYRIADRRVAAELVPALHGMLERHGRPEALALAVGPGSFTGLRVSAMAVRSLAWVEDLPVLAVDTMAAIAVASGPGLRLVLLSQKRDATFHALWQVDADGGLRELWPSEARADDAKALSALPIAALVVGPALAGKPALAERWAPGLSCGSTSGCTALAVARVARSLSPCDWRTLLPRYHVASAPEMQRAARKGG